MQYSFSPDEVYFVARISFECSLIFESATGRLIDERWLRNRSASRATLTKEADSWTIYEAIKRLASEDEADRIRGKRLWEPFPRQDKIEILKTAIHDEKTRISHQDNRTMRLFYIRKMAKELLQELDEDVPDDLILEERCPGQSGHKGK